MSGGKGEGINPDFKGRRRERRKKSEWVAGDVVFRNCGRVLPLNKAHKRLGGDFCRLWTAKDKLPMHSSSGNRPKVVGKVTLVKVVSMVMLGVRELSVAECHGCPISVCLDCCC